MLPYIGLIVIVMAIAFVATVMIGNSKQNKQDNPDYMKKSARNMTRLTLIYVVATAICIGLFIYLINN